MASLLDQLSADIASFTVDDESKLALVCEELAVANDKISNLCAKVNMCHDQMDCSEPWASSQYSRAVHERFEAESDHRSEVSA